VGSTWTPDPRGQQGEIVELRTAVEMERHVGENRVEQRVATRSVPSNRGHETFTSPVQIVGDRFGDPVGIQQELIAFGDLHAPLFPLDVTRRQGR
jgi:hypothetical protein